MFYKQSKSPQGSETPAITKKKKRHGRLVCWRRRFLNNHASLKLPATAVAMAIANAHFLCTTVLRVLDHDDICVFSLHQTRAEPSASSTDASRQWWSFFLDMHERTYLNLTVLDKRRIASNPGIRSLREAVFQCSGASQAAVDLRRSLLGALNQIVEVLLRCRSALTSEPNRDRWAPPRVSDLGTHSMLRPSGTSAVAHHKPAETPAETWP